MRPLALLVVLCTTAAAQPGPARTEAGVLYLTSIGGNTDRVVVRTEPPGMGGGGAVAVWHRLGDGLAVRARVGAFQVAVPQEEATLFGPNTFRTVDAAVAVRLEHALGRVVRASLGPQVAVGGWQLEAGDELAAYLERIGTRIVDDTGVLWRADLALGLAVGLPRGAALRAGLDLPLVPHNRWGRRVEIREDRGASGPARVRRYVPVPRVHVGVSVRLR